MSDASAAPGAAAGAAGAAGRPADTALPAGPENTQQHDTYFSQLCTDVARVVGKGHFALRPSTYFLNGVSFTVTDPGARIAVETRRTPAARSWAQWLGAGPGGTTEKTPPPHPPPPQLHVTVGGRVLIRGTSVVVATNWLRGVKHQPASLIASLPALVSMLMQGGQVEPIELTLRRGVDSVGVGGDAAAELVLTGSIKVGTQLLPHWLGTLPLPLSGSTPVDTSPPEWVAATKTLDAALQASMNFLFEARSLAALRLVDWESSDLTLGWTGGHEFEIDTDAVRPQGAHGKLAVVPLRSSVRLGHHGRGERGVWVTHTVRVVGRDGQPHDVDLAAECLLAPTAVTLRPIAAPAAAAPAPRAATGRHGGYLVGLLQRALAAGNGRGALRLADAPAGVSVAELVPELAATLTRCGLQHARVHPAGQTLHLERAAPGLWERLRRRLGLAPRPPRGLWLRVAPRLRVHPGLGIGARGLWGWCARLLGRWITVELGAVRFEAGDDTDATRVRVHGRVRLGWLALPWWVRTTMPALAELDALAQVERDAAAGCASAYQALPLPALPALDAGASNVAFAAYRTGSTPLGPGQALQPLVAELSLAPENGAARLVYEHRAQIIEAAAGRDAHMPIRLKVTAARARAVAP